MQDNEEKTNLFEELIEKAEGYGKTSIELLKLKAVDKTSDVTSSIVSRFALVIVLSMFIILLNIAAALWLGDVLGKSYYGFLVVASFYGIIAIIIFLIHPWIKKRVTDSIITKIFK